MLERRPELRPLPFNSRALKQCIEQTNAQRKPGGGLSAKALAEVEYLLSRLAKHDPRARLAPL